MPTIWPPQGQPSFEFKMPCCACASTCKSVTGSNLSSACNLDWSVFPPTTKSYPPSTYTFTQSYNEGGPIFLVTFTFTGVNNCNGTWTFTLSGLNVTSSSPGVSGIGGIEIHSGGQFPSIMHNGDTATSLFGCGTLSTGGLGISVNWFYSFGGHLIGTSTGDTGASNNFAPASPALAPDLIEYFINDPTSPYPFDKTGDCSSGFVKQGYCPDQFSFHYFSQTFTVTGLTAGVQYCLQIPYQWQPLSGGSWSPLASICIQFTATGPTETTGFVDVGAGAVLAAAPGGANYRVDPAGPTCVPDPTGSICGSC